MISNHLRLATKEDLPELVKFSKNFVSSSPYRLMKFDSEKTKAFLSAIIDRSMMEGVILVALKDGKPKGFLVGVVEEPVFSRNRLAMEIAWWVEPDARGSRGALLMYSAYEDWAKRVGCSHIHGAYLPGVSPDLDRFYTKRGYIQTESSYTKVLKL